MRLHCVLLSSMFNWVLLALLIATILDQYVFIVRKERCRPSYMWPDFEQIHHVPHRHYELYLYREGGPYWDQLKDVRFHSFMLLE